VNPAWGNCKLRVRRWPTPRAAFVFSAPVDADCHILCANFCKVFGLLLSGKYGLLRTLKIIAVR
jgi:hypothetical protein